MPWVGRVAHSALTRQALTQQVLPRWLGGNLAITQLARPWVKNSSAVLGQDPTGNAFLAGWQECHLPAGMALGRLGGRSVS